MNFNIKLLCVTFLTVSFIAGFHGRDAAQTAAVSSATVSKENVPQEIYARAVLRGANNEIRGIVLFTQSGVNTPQPGVDISAVVRGPVSLLQPGQHGMHIHENGTCEPDFNAAGGHFDPGPFGSSTPVDANHPYHMGDIPNLTVTQISKSGVGQLTHQSSRITLSPGPLSVFDSNGSSVIIHLNPDRGEPGVTGASGGARIACGVIESVTDPQADREYAEQLLKGRKEVKND